MKKSYYNMEFLHNDSVILLNTMTGSVVLLNMDEYNNYLSDSCSDDEKNMLHHLGIYVNDEINERDIINKARNIATTCRRPHFRILPTTSCNAQCAYCFEKNIPISQMSIETCKAVVKFIDSMVKESDTVSVTWFGGEPLLAVNQIGYMTNSLNDVFSKKRITPRYRLISNGSLITRELSQIMKYKWNLEHVQITIDGFGNQYDEIKKYNNPDKYNFATITDNIGYLLQAGLNVSIRMNYDGNNTESLIKLISFFHKKFGTSTGTLDKNLRLYVSPIWPSDFNNEKMNYYQTNKSQDGYLRVIKFLVEMKDISLSQLMDIRLVSSVCSARNTNGFSILPNGDLLKCCEAYDEVIGNIYSGITDKSLEGFWISEQLEKECEDCKLLPMCQGGCKAAYHRALCRCKLSYEDLHKIVELYVEELNKQH